MPVLEALKSALGETLVLTGDRRPARAMSDASGCGHHLPLAVLRPTSVEVLAQALSICNAFRQPVVPQGGLTGLAGGAVPRPGDMALSLDLICGIEDIDRDAGTMTVRAGTPLETAQKAAEDAGFLLPIDLGARGSCQIGGNLSTNAGGIRVLRHGVTRDNVLGLEAVLADGTVISSLNKMQKNNTGYDLKQLFIGSEGTLGIITRAVLKLKPLRAGRQTALVALASYEHAVSLLQAAQRDLTDLSAFEIMWASYFDVSRAGEGLAFFAQAHPFYAIVELTGSETAEPLETFLAAAFDAGLLTDALIAQSEKEARAFWLVREGAALDRLPSLLNFDVSLPIGAIGTFAERCMAGIRSEFSEAHVSFFGHMADSNIHIAVSVGPADEVLMHRVDEIVYGCVSAFSGSISAEHGIGTLKRDFLHLSRGPAELELMRRIKAALDPNGILNPGKVLPEA